MSSSTVSVSQKPEVKLPKGESSKVNRVEENVIPPKLHMPHVQTQQQQFFKESCWEGGLQLIKEKDEKYCSFLKLWKKM